MDIFYLGGLKAFALFGRHVLGAARKLGHTGVELVYSGFYRGLVSKSAEQIAGVSAGTDVNVFLTGRILGGPQAQLGKIHIEDLGMVGVVGISGRVHGLVQLGIAGDHGKVFCQIILICAGGQVHLADAVINSLGQSVELAVVVAVLRGSRQCENVCQAEEHDNCQQYSNPFLCFHK